MPPRGMSKRVAGGPPFVDWPSNDGGVIMAAGTYAAFCTEGKSAMRIWSETVHQLPYIQRPSKLWSIAEAAGIPLTSQTRYLSQFE
jgi:hypothetical protein